MEQAPEALFTTHRESLRRIALRIVDDVDDADDVLQTVALRLLTRSDRTRPINVHYLTHAVRIAALELRRNAVARCRLTNRWIHGSAMRASVPDPERHRRCHEAIGMVFDAMTELTPAERSAFESVEVSGYTHLEACEMLDVSPKTLTQRLYRARRTIRRYLTRNGVTCINDL